MSSYNFTVNAGLISNAKRFGIIYLASLIDLDDKKLKGFFPRGKTSILIWNRKHDDVAQQFSGDSSTNLENFEGILIKEDEIAVYRAPGITQILPQGLWKLEKSARNRFGARVLFMYSGEIKLKWGIPITAGLLTADDISVGMSGEAKFRIANPIEFVKMLNGISYNPLKVEHFREIIINELVNLFRNVIGKTTADMINKTILQRDILGYASKNLCCGVTIDEIKVMYIALPPSYLAERTRNKNELGEEDIIKLD